MLGVYTASISGAHFNPAATLTNCVYYKFPWRKISRFQCGTILPMLFRRPPLRRIFVHGEQPDPRAMDGFEAFHQTTSTGLVQHFAALLCVKLCGTRREEGETEM